MEEAVTVVHYQLEGTTAVVQMDDGKANALSDVMIAQLGKALALAESEAHAVVLAGRPDRFCAGFDLKVMMSSPEAATALVRSGADLLMRLYGSPLPIVAACTGHAVAGGALVLLSSDVRIGAAGAFRIGLNEVSIGLPVPRLAMELARDRLARTELGRATLGARMYTPEEAARVGFLDEVTAASEVLARAREEAARLGAYSRMAYRGTKRRLRRATIDHILSSLEEDLRAVAAGE
jgi:enoyl-CoA hydratase